MSKANQISRQLWGSRTFRTSKLMEAQDNITETLWRLTLQHPFPVDPSKFYAWCMPDLGWLHSDSTRARNLKYMLSLDRVVHFTAMDDDAYTSAVTQSSLSVYDAVFWLMLPEPVVTYPTDACAPLNIPTGHFAYRTVMEWWEKQREIEAFIGLTRERIDSLAELAISVRELTVAFPELAAHCRLKFSAAAVSKQRGRSLVEAKERIWSASEAANLIEKLNTASLLPDVDHDIMQYGLNWR